MKLFFSALLIIIMILALAACSHARESSGGADSESATTWSEDKTTEYNSGSEADKPSENGSPSTNEGPGGSTRAAEESPGSSVRSPEESSTESNPPSSEPSSDTAASADTTASAEMTIGPGEAYWVSGVSVNFRKAPGNDGEIICQLEKGAEVEALREEGDWLYIRYGETMGYIHKDLLLCYPPYDPSAGEVRLVVKKAEHRLEVWQGETLVITYPVGLGRNPVGHKQREGDGKTPEGEYYVCVKNGNSRYYLSLGISYPNKEDAAAALKDGRIDQATYDRIADAIDKRERPDWYTPLGGEIMIHGHGSASDWTAGCIAVENEVMDMLFVYCSLGTRITILP